MAWRTTQEEVRTVVESDPDISMVPFINAASSLTDYVESQDSDSLLSDSLLQDIEVWLAAHFYSVRDLPYHEKETGDAEAKFQGKTAMGLDFTGFGQTAKVLDLTGTLSRLDTAPRPVASCSWLGKPKSEQTAYENRD